MAVDVNEYILRLNIPINNVMRMQILKSKEQLGKIKASLLFGEFLNLTQMEEHFTASTEVHHEKELCFGLEGPVEFYDEWMIDFLHDLALIDNGFDLLLAREFVLAHDLHRVQAPRVLLPDQDHPAERASPDYFDLLKIMASDLELLIGKSTLSEGELGKVSTQKLIVF